MPSDFFFRVFFIFFSIIRRSVRIIFTLVRANWAARDTTLGRASSRPFPLGRSRAHALVHRHRETTTTGESVRRALRVFALTTPVYTHTRVREAAHAFRFTIHTHTHTRIMRVCVCINKLLFYYKYITIRSDGLPPRFHTLVRLERCSSSSVRASSTEFRIKRNTHTSRRYPLGIFKRRVAYERCSFTARYGQGPRDFNIFPGSANF